ncbi:MAG: hypothetical protein QM730_16040 [Anaerolineales bacterium]
MKKLALATLTTLTLILTACGASSTTPQAGPANQDRALPAATQLIVGTFKLDGTAQTVTAEQAKELLPMWQVYQDLLTSDNAAQEEIAGLVEQIQGTMTAEQNQAITAMNLTQRDVFTLMQEKGLGMGGGQRNNSSGGNSTGNGNNFGGGGFVPPDGGVPGGGFPGGGPDGGFGGNQSRNNSNSQNGTSTTTTRQQFNGATVLLDPLIELLKQKAGS